MIRKLVKQGDNALTVTLPAHWIKDQGLKTGNEVHLQEIGRNIEISAARNKSEKKI
jgi:antitoxin component of MazEF toxin-antitoxin module